MKQPLFTSLQVSDNFTPAPIFLQSLQDGDETLYAITINNDAVLSRKFQWDIKPAKVTEAWKRDHFWRSFREAMLRADVAIKNYQKAIQECSIL
jgi:hypothetical protein